MYAIDASVITKDAHGWTRTHHVPTFYLHPTVQGITSHSHAVNVAADILGSVTPVDAVHHFVNLRACEEFLNGQERDTTVAIVSVVTVTL